AGRRDPRPDALRRARRRDRSPRRGAGAGGGRARPGGHRLGGSRAGKVAPHLGAGPLAPGPRLAVLEAAAVSYGRSNGYLPVIELLKSHAQIEPRDDARQIREKLTGKVRALDPALEATLPALLALLDVPVDDLGWARLDPPQRRRRTLEALKRLLLRESQVQPLLLVFEDLHWIDTETQAVLDMLVESLPTARVLLLVNYRPEYQHGWGSKTYYTQLRLDPLPEASAEALLQALLGEDARLGPLTQLLMARTQGNPFFLEESVR